jgi:hypothetical protein
VKEHSFMMHLFATASPEQALELGNTSVAVEARATPAGRLEAASV